MRHLKTDEYKQVSAILERKCLALWDVENTQNGIPRDCAQTRFPLNLSYAQKISADVEMIVFRNNSFIRHLKYCKEVLSKNNIQFEKGNAIQILEKMFNLSIEKQWGKTFEYYIDNVCIESCSYILYKEGTAFYDKILRVDLCRKIDYNDEKSFFSGGLFHALNHFTTDKTNKIQRNFLYDVEELMYYSAYAFFMGKDISSINDRTLVKAIMNPKHNSWMKFVYFNEKNSNVCFIKTIIPQKKQQDNKQL